ncbi:MAG: 1-acyl-sn-glycerol-3-phosphate acyltransferase [Dehalococcoidales bacterium]|nr:MAG: 1-acyl-sn-glycerol-3-phosphate acyltransferase [Dehalococcoidales bacterium]
MHWVYRVSYPAVYAFYFILCRWQIKGKENVPKEGPLLVVANHMTNHDPPLLSVSLGRYVVFMAKEGLFRSRLGGYFMRGLGTFPVRRNGVQREALRTAQQVLADGYALAVFPEGMRSRTHKLRRAFPGAALIALQTGVPVLPVAITGTEAVKGINWLRRPRLTVTFGQPFCLLPTNGKTGRGECAEYIMERIAELLPAGYRGVYTGVGVENNYDSKD